MAYNEAQAIAEVRRILNEAVASMWTDADISAWLGQAALDLSVKARCVEREAVVNVPAQGSVAVPTGTIGIEAVLHSDGSALAKDRPRQFGHTASEKTGPPTDYAHFAQKLYVFPRPAAPTPLTVLYWISTMAFTDLPEAYHELAIVHAVMKAKLKEEKYAVAAQLYDVYAQGLQFQRHDLQDRMPDSREMLRRVDRLVAAGA